MRANGQRTFSRGVGLDEAVAGADVLELGGQPGELGQVLVDETDFGSKVVFVNVLCEKAAGVAWNSVSMRGREARMDDAPSPPMMRTAGLSLVAGALDPSWAAMAKSAGAQERG